MEIRRRQSPGNPEMHQFYIYDDGEEYPFYEVKNGRVTKQKALAELRKQEQQDKPSKKTA